jgi:hypothetical protein
LLEPVPPVVSSPGLVSPSLVSPSLVDPGLVSPSLVDPVGEGGEAGPAVSETDTAQLLLEWEGARIALRRTFEDLVTMPVGPGLTAA